MASFFLDDSSNAMSEELSCDVNGEEEIKPVQLIQRTFSNSHGEKRVIPVLQVIGGTGHSPTERNSSSNSGSSRTSIGSARKSSEESSSENRAGSASIPSTSADRCISSSSDSTKLQSMIAESRRLQGERPSIDESIKLRDEEFEEEEGRPVLVLNSADEANSGIIISDTSEFDPSLLDGERSNSRSWNVFQSSLAASHDESWDSIDTPFIATQPGISSEFLPGIDEHPIIIDQSSLTSDDCQDNNNHILVDDPVEELKEDLVHFNRPESPNLGFHRIASDQLIVTKNKPPKIVGNYLFGDLLGEGAYGKVKECLEMDTLCRRAVKILKGQRMKKVPNGEENLHQEIILLRKLDNLHCVRLVDVLKNEIKQKTYVVMELCCGSLQEMLDRFETHRFPIWQAHRYFVQLVEGLAYLRLMGVIHKDIKPSNLLLSTNETLKISDFGVAEQIDLFDFGNNWCMKTQGTPKFQAPEIAQGKTEFCGFAVDIWSAGITLYNLVSGEYPFDGGTIIILYENIAKQPLAMPTSIQIDSKLDTLLRGMLEKDPDRRIKIDAVAKSEWLRWKFEADEATRVSLPPLNGDSSRSLTVSRVLERMYDGGVQSPTLSAQNVSEANDFGRLISSVVPLDQRALERLRVESQNQHRLDITSSDEALSFMVNTASASKPSERYEHFEQESRNREKTALMSSGSDQGVGNWSGSEKNGSTKADSLRKSTELHIVKAEHGKFCRLKQRFCTIQ